MTGKSSTDPAEVVESDESIAEAAPAGEEPPAEPNDAPAATAEPQTEEPAEVDPLTEALAARDNYLDSLQRVTAEFANFRKQVDKRSADVRANAANSVVESLLPVLDACDAAVLQGSEDVAPILSALLDTLNKQGLEVQDPAGQPFDPELYEAVMTEAGDGELVVSEVLRTGYSWKGRVVRPAMVKVRG